MTETHSGRPPSRAAAWDFRKLPLLLACQALWCVAALAHPATVRFVQITDPHLFDQGGEEESQGALAAFVRRLNERVAEGVAYEFVAVTGDLGVEGLVSVSVEEPSPERDGKPTKRSKLKPTADIEAELERGASEAAAILAASQVKLWLFVPGNNDLVEESPDTINYYHDFVQRLARKLLPHRIRVIDLCAPAPQGGPRPGVYRTGDYAFIGFNNASFKNNYRFDCLARNRARQREEHVGQVLDGVNSAGAPYLYIFYHIPELDDPYPIFSGDTRTAVQRQARDRPGQCFDPGKPEKYYPAPAGGQPAPDGKYQFSAWFVGDEVRAAWDEVVRLPEVKGLFAGHYHDWRRATYLDHHWVRQSVYRPDSFLKLHVCPPLSAKFQDGPSQARGYQEVTLDERGRVGANVFWYDAAAKSFEGAATGGEAEALRQLRAGMLYEETGRLKEAEAAYAKALDAATPSTREAAFVALRRVTEKSLSPLNEYLLTPLGRPLGRRGIWMARVFTAIILATLLVVLLGLYVRRRGRNRLGIEPFADLTKDKAGGLFVELLKVEMEKSTALPLIVDGRSQFVNVVEMQAASELGELVELLPGSYGKIAGVVTRRVDKPEYSIGGLLVQDGESLQAAVSLKREGKVLRLWEVVLSPPDLVGKQRVLASTVLSYLRGL
ncbi:MAG: hypothetical protein M3416_05295 [Acidobacteriota bacterium]|nr:hypothetical protein [Acidobacteriota bacterium]